MKYEVQHTLSGMHHPEGDVFKAKPVGFKPGDIVTESQLKDAGFDHEFLLKNNSIEALKGTEDQRDRDRQGPPPAPTTTTDATPHMATAPLVESDSPKTPRERDEANRRQNSPEAQPRREPSRVHEEKVDARRGGKGE